VIHALVDMVSRTSPAAAGGFWRANLAQRSPGRHLARLAGGLGAAGEAGTIPS